MLMALILMLTMFMAVLVLVLVLVLVTPWLLKWAFIAWDVVFVVALLCWLC